MDNSALFKMILTKSLSFKIIHVIFILLEYITLILSSTFTSIQKILLFFCRKTIVNQRLPQSYLLIAVLNNTKISLISIAPLTIAVIGIMFIIIYYLLFFFYVPKGFMDHSPITEFFQSIIVNIFDFIAFRYCSFLFIDSFIFMVVFSAKTATIIYTLISLCVFIVFFIYIMTIIHYINSYCLEFYVNNKQISELFPSYAFSSSIRECDSYLLLVKVLISFENNYSLNETTMNYFGSGINILIFFILVGFPLKVLISSFLYDINELYSQINTEINLFRYFIMIFHLFISLSILLFTDYHKDIGLFEIIILSIGGITIALIGTFYFYWQSHQILFNGKLNANKVLLLFTQEQSKQSHNHLFYCTIYNKLLMSHFLQCNKKCLFCEKHKVNNIQDDYMIKPFHLHSQPLNTHLIFLFKLFEQEQKKKQSLNRHNKDENEIILYKLLHLFYSRFKGKIFKFFYDYSKFKRDHGNTSKILINNMELLIYCCYKNDMNKRNNKEFFDEVLAFSNINNDIYNSLIPLKEYVSSETSVLFPEKLIKLSKTFKHIRISLLTALLKVDISNEHIYQDLAMKTIKNILKYSLIMARYIIETLFNESYRVLPPLDMEIFEEYLTTHFSTDKAIIIALSFSKKARIELNILTFTGSFSNEKNKYLHQYFPKRVMREGYDLFLKHLFSYNHLTKKDDKIVSEYQPTTSNSFEFLIQNKSYIEYFHYCFQLSTDMCSNTSNLLLFGFYTCDYSKVLLVENRLNEQTIIGFSKALKDILCLKSKWLDILSKYQMTLSLESLFENVKLTRKPIRGTRRSSQKLHFTIDDTDIANEYDCIVKYNTFAVKVMNFIKVLSICEELKGNKSELNSLENARKMLLDKKNTTITMKLRKLFSISDNKIVYYIILLDQNTIIDKTDLTMNQIIEKQYNCIVNIKCNQSIESSIHGERTPVSDSNSTLKTDKRVQLKDRKNCTAERRKMQMLSLITLILSLMVVVICFAFIFIQNNITKQLQAVTNIFTQYKTTKLSLISIFNSFCSTLCYTKHADDHDCINAVTLYTDKLHAEANLPQEILLQEYMGFEMKNKVMYFQGMFAKLKTMLHATKDPILINIPLQIMNYTMLNYLSVPGKIEQFRMQFTMEEGIRTYYNTYIYITRFNYQIVPFYVLTMDKAFFSFEYLERLNRSFTELEIDMYKSIINFPNYDFSFRAGESTILQKFASLRIDNLTYLILFIILELGLNIFIMILSRANIITAYDLFKEIIDKIQDMIMDPSFQSYFLTKINNLILLSQLYTINPNKKIKQITKEADQYKEKNKKKLVLAKISEKSKLNQSISPQDASDLSITTLLPPSLSLFPRQIRTVDRKDDNIYRREIIKYIKLNWFLFIGIFIFIIIFDGILIDRFITVFNSFTYVVGNYHLENWIYICVAYSHMNFIFNTTEENLISMINETIPDNHLIDSYIRTTFGFYVEMNTFQAKSQKKYPPLQSYFTYECDPIVKQVNDSFFNSADVLLKKNYTALSVFVCKHFNLLYLKNFEQLHRELLMRVRTVFYGNKGKRSYNELAYYHRNQETIDIYLIQLMFLRPLKKWYVVSILSVLISNDFKDYINFVICFMVMNSIAELIVFIVIRYGVIKRLTSIQDELFLLKKSFE